MIRDLKFSVIVGVVATLINLVIVMPVCLGLLDNPDVMLVGFGIVSGVSFVMAGGLKTYLRAVQIGWSVGMFIPIFPINLMLGCMFAIIVGAFGILLPIVPILLGYFIETK